MNICVKHSFFQTSWKSRIFCDLFLVHVVCPKDPDPPPESGSDEKLSNIFKSVLGAVMQSEQVSPGQCFQTLPNISDATLSVVLVAFPSFLSSPGSGHYAYGDDEDWYSRRYKGDHMLSLTLPIHAHIHIIPI